MKKRKEAKVTTMHQHKDVFGNIFGMSHPADAYHKNPKTLAAHHTTVGNGPGTVWIKDKR